MNKDRVVIVGASRTPIGALGGELSTLSASDLGSVAIAESVRDAGLDLSDVEDVVMGLVLSAGQGQAPARQASIAAGIPMSSGATTINKMCGSGMKAVMLANDGILVGTSAVVVAGGMESMSNAPFLLPQVRAGKRMGHGQMLDHMFLDGLEDFHGEGKGTLMGVYADKTAEIFQFTREDQDEFAIRSLQRAQKASEDGTFTKEITGIQFNNKNRSTTVDLDEQPQTADLTKIPHLRPAFVEDGTVTAANSSSISDGAAALVLMKQSEAEKRSLVPLAAIQAHANHSQKPESFTTAPIGAINKVIEKSGWNKKEVDLYEINEAFAVVPMAAIRDLGLSAENVNIHGGACAIGHPVGASGARIIVTLLNGLKKFGLSKGIASLCIGGGEATAIAIESIH